MLDIVERATPVPTDRLTALSISEAQARTIAAGSACVLAEARARDPGGEPLAGERAEPGEADFVNSRVSYWATRSYRRESFPRYAVIWDGPNKYAREPGDTGWSRVDFEDLDAMPYGSPLWGLHVLAGCTDEVLLVGREEVRGALTTRLRGGADRVLAEQKSSIPLAFPPQRVRVFPVEVWIDADGLIRRVAYTWRLTRARLGRRRQSGYWNVTEFWDFGVAVDLPAMPPIGDGGRTAH